MIEMMYIKQLEDKIKIMDQQIDLMAEQLDTACGTIKELTDKVEILRTVTRESGEGVPGR